MKLPRKFAELLAKLHDVVMECQDEFDYFKNQLYSNDFEDDEIESYELGKYNIDNLTETIEEICDKLDDLESETSELDCEYNDYGY